MKKGQASDIQIDAMELLKSILSQLGVNHTFFMQFTLIMICYFFLSRYLFKPVLTILLVREHKVDGIRMSADIMLFEHDKIAGEYKAKWRDYEIKARDSGDKIISKARLESEKIIDDAEGKAAEYLRSKRHDIEVEAEKLSVELGNSSAEIEKLIKTKLLGA